MANRNVLMDNMRVDLQLSPEMERLLTSGSEIAPIATKLGLRAVTKQGSKEVKAKIRSLGLVKTGAYEKSVRGSTTKTKSVIASKLWYAHILEGGAKPHRIKPRVKHKRSGSRTRFYKGLYINGRWVKSVMHPGIRAYDVFDGTWKVMQQSGEVKSLFAAAVQQAIAEVQNGG